MIAEEHDATRGLKLVTLTVATDETDGFKRFMRSANIFDIPVKVTENSIRHSGLFTSIHGPFFFP